MQYKFNNCKETPCHFDRWLDIEQIIVSGGHLDHSTDLETLREKGGYELIILLRNSAGKVKSCGKD